MRIFLLLLIAIVTTGCETDTSPTGPPSPPPAAIGSAFDQQTCGSISGRLTWNGPLPTAQDFPHHTPKADGTFVLGTAPNPYRPVIDPQTRSLAGVVVLVQGVDPAVSRPWDLPPVAVEMSREKITVVQGERRGRVGFVRRGDSISVASTEGAYHVFRGRGDAFFSLTLPEPGKPTNRVLNTCGRVELSSGSGLYWMRGDLFVAEHPYFTVTDAEGRFTLDRVPSGRVKLVAWHPSWDTARKERDPDSVIVTRMVYSSPLERTAIVDVRPGAMVKADMTLP
ncbi:MAG: hypothetical protein U0792_07295 [Gemmataceae bacterium]